MNRVKFKYGDFEASASGEDYVSDALTFGVGIGGLGLAGYGFCNLLKGTGNMLLNWGSAIVGAFATGWALNHAEKKEEHRKKQNAEKPQEPKVEVKDVNILNSATL